MKNISLIFFAIGVFGFNTYTFSQSTKTVVIRVLESSPEEILSNRYFVITITKDNTDDIEVLEYNSRKSTNQGNVTVIIRNILNEYFNQGYELLESTSISFNSPTSSVDGFLTTFILQKKE